MAEQKTSGDTWVQGFRSSLPLSPGQSIFALRSIKRSEKNHHDGRAGSSKSVPTGGIPRSQRTSKGGGWTDWVLRSKLTLRRSHNRDGVPDNALILAVLLRF